MITLACANRKGGVGKTTTAWILATGLAARGHRVLAVDLDAQRNLSLVMGADLTRQGTTLDLMSGKVPAKECVQELQGCGVIAASPFLAQADVSMTGQGREFFLRDHLKEISDGYDYCVLDCPPSLGILSVNALAMADYMLIPAQAEMFSLQGITDMASFYADIRRLVNPKLGLCGILMTRVQSRATLTRQAIHQAAVLAAQLKTQVFATAIRESVVIREAQSMRQPLTVYAPKSPVTQDYENFLEEFLARIAQ